MNTTETSSADAGQMPPVELMTNVAGTGSNPVLDSSLEIVCAQPLRRKLGLRPAVGHNPRTVIREQITNWESRALARVGVMTGGHLDG